MDGDTRLAHLAAIVEGSDDAIVSKDLHGIIQTWNPSAQRIFGFTPQEAIGHPMTILFPPDRIPEEAKILRQIAAGNRINHYETQRRRKDGTLVDVSVTVSPIRDASGRVVGASKIARDITVQKRTEAQLREANARLQRLDAERREFLNLVAHELRTPLTPIMLQLEMLQLTPDEPPEPGALARIERSMARLNALVEQILSMARLERGTLQLRLAQVDLCPALRETVTTFEQVARQAQVRLDLVCEGPVTVVGDLDRLVQVFTNLLSNSVKFTPAGGSVRLEARRVDDRVELAVTDTGAGFTPQQAARLFQPFVRLDERKQGTGLGLYISRSIARQHGGDLEASSPGPGRGATFTLVLPALGPESPAGATQPLPGGTASTEEAPPRPPSPGPAGQRQGRHS